MVLGPVVNKDRKNHEGLARGKVMFSVFCSEVQSDGVWLVGGSSLPLWDCRL